MRRNRQALIAGCDPNTRGSKMHHITNRLHRSSTSNGGHHEREDAAAREREKRKLCDWEAEKKPMSYDEILVDPNKKLVGHSSKVLRYEDFELIKTLGTGECFGACF